MLTFSQIDKIKKKLDFCNQKHISIDGINLFVKSDGNSGKKICQHEGYCYGILAKSGEVKIPKVYFFDDNIIAVEDLGKGNSTLDDWKKAGLSLARLHKHTSPLFGLEKDGYCGDSIQINKQMSNGYDFFSQCRLLYQGGRAVKNGYLSSEDFSKIESFCKLLRKLVPEQPASLCHGDLWSGNLHCCKNGEVAFIDPSSVHYGWAEADLAFLTLFGSPPSVFFEAYQSEYGCDNSWKDRVDIYNLYHLLNHLNLFGRSYKNSVIEILDNNVV